ncbi:MAG TPA: thioredoxin family protein [Polyangia bacterium]|nr:thioredoxin family protein [Polyangia bacterium]
MSTVALTEGTFEEHVKKPGILVIDWWAPWCGPCRAFAPIYEKASQKFGDVTFAKINTEDEPALAATFQIQAIPTLMVFRDQVLIFARPGMIPGPALDDLVEKVKALDMEEVRREIAEQEKAEAEGQKAAPAESPPSSGDSDSDGGGEPGAP